MTRVARTILLVSIACLLAATSAYAQSDWSATRPNPMVTVEIRKLVGLLMLVPALTLFLLYVFVIGRRAARQGETGDVEASEREDVAPVAV